MAKTIATPHHERHRAERVGWLRAAVLGANDGLISTSSLLVGVAAAASSPQVVLMTGAAALVAGALSMAAGEYVSVSSQADTEAADTAREQRELEEMPEAELKELSARSAALIEQATALDKLYASIGYKEDEGSRGRLVEAASNLEKLVRPLASSGETEPLRLWAATLGMFNQEARARGSLDDDTVLGNFEVEQGRFTRALGRLSGDADDRSSRDHGGVRSARRLQQRKNDKSLTHTKPPVESFLIGCLPYPRLCGQAGLSDPARPIA